MNKPEYSKMVANLAKPGADIIKGLTPETAHLWHMATGISGEIGEILEYILLGKDIANFIEEAGDTEFYIEGLCQGIGIDVPEGAACITITTQLDGVAYAAFYASQIIDAVKKAAVYGKELDRELLISAIQGLCNALTVLYVTNNCDRQFILDENMGKLLTGKNARYAEGNYSDKQAQDRADKVDGQDVAKSQEPNQVRKYFDDVNLVELLDGSTGLRLLLKHRDCAMYYSVVGTTIYAMDMEDDSDVFIKGDFADAIVRHYQDGNEVMETLRKIPDTYVFSDALDNHDIKPSVLVDALSGSVDEPVAKTKKTKKVAKSKND